MPNTNCNNCHNCKYCGYCHNCHNCHNCNYCGNCHNCNYCYNCDYCHNCDHCDHCDYCNNCDYCDHCDYCYFCRNLKMTESNLFCYAEDKEKDGFQPKPLRVFNKVVTKERWKEIVSSLPSIQLDLTNNSYEKAWAIGWGNLSEEEKDKITKLDEFDAVIFWEITGIEVKEETINIDGVEYTLSELKKALKK